MNGPKKPSGDRSADLGGWPSGASSSLSPSVPCAKLAPRDIMEVLAY